MAAKEYQGHRSWNAWNVSLWINNDGPLYRFACDCLKRASRDRNGNERTKEGKVRHATRLFMLDMTGARTPDGARFNATCVRECLAGFDE